MTLSRAIRFSRRAPLVTLLLLLTCPPAAFGDVQPTVDRINSLPVKDRESLLLDAAKRQGVVSWYTTMQPQNAQEVLRLARERYPFLTVEVARLGHERLVNRLVTEYRAGKFTPDVITAPSPFVTALRQSGVIARSTAPFRQRLREGLKDGEGWVNPVYTNLYVMFYNTTLVKSEELPKSYEDLLHPRWRGRLAIDQEDVEWLAALIEVMGREKAIEFAKKLAAQKPSLRRGHTLLGQLVAAGEAALFPDQYLHSALTVKKAGAPVEMYFIEPVLTQASTAVWVARKAPRPEAALLFIDFLFSKEVQTVIAGLGRLPGRSDVTIPYALDGKRLHFLSTEWVGEKFTEVNDLFGQIFTGR